MNRRSYLIRLTGTTLLGVFFLCGSVYFAVTIINTAQHPRGSPSDWIALLPIVALGLVALILGIAFLYNSIHTRNTERRKRLRRDHRCPHCGYNLRGSEKNERGCPECGWGRSA